MLRQPKIATRLANAFALMVLLLLAVVAISWHNQYTLSITGPLGTAMVVANKVATGELDVEVSSTSSDETGQLLAALGRMVDNLADAVRQAAGQVQDSSQILVTSSGSLDDGARNQADAVGTWRAKWKASATTPSKMKNAG